MFICFTWIIIWVAGGPVDYTPVEWNIVTWQSCDYTVTWHPWSCAQSTGASQQETVWWTKSDFLGLLPKSGKDQWDCEIGNYYVGLPLHFLSLYLSICTFFEQVWHQIFWKLLGDTVAKMCASRRNLTWFTRSFPLVRGWGLGMRLWHLTQRGELEMSKDMASNKFLHCVSRPRVKLAPDQVQFRVATWQPQLHFRLPCDSRTDSFELLRDSHTNSFELPRDSRTDSFRLSCDN